MSDSAITEDAILGGTLRVRQPKRGHRVGHDAMLLAAATAANAGEHAVELGAGVGAAGLALARRVGGLQVTLVEIDASLAALAGQNAALNALGDRVRAVHLDVAASARAFAAAGLPQGCAARVLMNPPFNDTARQNASPDASRRLAHASAEGLLATWVRRAGFLLAPGGTITLIWRADGIAEVLDALGHAFGGIAILPVHPKPDTAAIRVLVGATKGSRAPLRLLAGLALNDADGRPAAQAEAVLRDGAVLPLARP
jgi:tRNA1(Val) A37 N6-methylase TrmN6